MTTEKDELKMQVLELTPYDRSVLAAMLSWSPVSHVNERISSMTDDGRELALKVLAINTTQVSQEVEATVNALKQILL